MMNQFVYRSSEMSKIISEVEIVANSRGTILLQGEVNTGKEALAKLIHCLSPRKGNAFTSFCCGINKDDMESLLFGDEKNNMTGVLHESDGGTLFLEDIEEIPSHVQVKLLRFLNNNHFQKVNGRQFTFANVRIIGATKYDLEPRMKEGTFREDLFYKLNAVKIVIPPLRDRRDDILPLVEHFIERIGSYNNKEITGTTDEVKDILLRYAYPGNIGELENIIERAIIISRNSVISCDDLPEYVCISALSANSKSRKNRGLRYAVEELERNMIADAMARADHHQSNAAKILDISERMLRYKLTKYSIKDSE